MVKQRIGWKVVIIEPAKSRIEQDICPGCELPRDKWKRRKDWRCCSTKCTKLFKKMYIYYGWKEIREKAVIRDNYTCRKCGIQPTTERLIGNKYSTNDYINALKVMRSFIRFEGEGENYRAIMIDSSQVVGDHIIPIAIGGEEFDIDNVQTLCKSCNKIKTKKDHGDIAIYRKKENVMTEGQEVLNG